jgi:hypothetical protein
LAVPGCSRPRTFREKTAFLPDFSHFPDKFSKIPGSIVSRRMRGNLWFMRLSPTSGGRVLRWLLFNSVPRIPRRFSRFRGKKTFKTFGHFHRTGGPNPKTFGHFHDSNPAIEKPPGAIL